MSDYKRRQFQQGGTLPSVMTQPFIRGNAKKDTSGAFTATSLILDVGRLTLQSDLGTHLITYSSGSATLLMTDVVAEINTQSSGDIEAEDVEGVLVVRTPSSGDGTFIKVHASPPAAGFFDIASTFGLDVDPHPESIARSGDLDTSPVRSRTEKNPQGTTFIAHGEDRSSRSYNRGLHQLALNTDTLNAQLLRFIAVPLVLEIEDGGSWAPFLTKDSNGHLEQIDLSDLASINPDWAGRIYVGGLNRLSPRDDISKYWAVHDRDDNEILVGDTVLRVGAVHRGAAGSAPTFSDEFSAPSGALADTGAGAPDGLNALGVQRPKSSSVAISLVKNNTIVVCPGATFVTDNVFEGDIATISSATINVPFNHNGDYYVEAVLGEEELILSPISPSNVQSLNPDTSGTLGDITVRANGDFSPDVHITLDPPLPRFPENGRLRIVLGLEKRLGEMSVAALLGFIKASEEVDGYVFKNLKRNLSLQGVYDKGADGGAGFAAVLDKRPLRLEVDQLPLVSGAGSLERTGTGKMLSAGILEGNAAETFVEADLGKLVLITGTGYLDKEPFYITEIWDGRHAVITSATASRVAGVPPVAADPVTYDIYAAARVEMPGALHVVGSHDTVVAGEGARQGVIYENRQSASGTAEPTRGQSMLHLENIKLNRAGTNISRITITSFQSTTEIELPFDPEDTYHLRGWDTDTKGFLFSLLYCQILNGVDAGWYRVKRTVSFSGMDFNGLELENLDGSTVSLTTTPGITTVCSLYYAAMAVNEKILQVASDFYRPTLSLFADQVEGGEFLAMPLMVDWRGEGAGISGNLNDPNFVAFDKGDGADGFFSLVTIYPPANGHRVRGIGSQTGVEGRRSVRAYEVEMETYGFDRDIEGTGYQERHGWGGWFHQDGKDPSLLVTKTRTFSSGPGKGIIDTADFASVASLIVGYEGDHSGRSSAIDVMGSIFVRRAAGSWTINGGVFSETVVGAGRLLQPIYNAETTPASEPYVGVAPFTGFTAPTRLGTPGVILPKTDVESNPSAFLRAAQYSEFNVEHVATLAINPVKLEEPYSQYIGMSLEIVEDLSGSGIPSGTRYTIVAAKNVGSTDWLALDAGPVGVTNNPTEYRILGARWHESYISMADWMLLGTKHAIPTELWKLTALSIGQDYEDALDRNTAFSKRIGIGDQNRLAAGGLLTQIPYSGDTAGTGLGLPVALASMTNVQNGAGADIDSWEQDAEDPRAPIANTWATATGLFGEFGVFEDPSVGTGRQRISPEYDWRDAYSGDLLGASGFALDLDDGDWSGSSLRPTVRYTSFSGGALRIELKSDGGQTTEGPFSLWKRGTKLIASKKFSFRGTVILDLKTSRTMQLELTLSDGTILAQSVLSSIPTGVQERVADFNTFDLTDAAWDALDQSVKDQGVHLVLSGDLESSAVADDYIHVVKMHLEQIGRPARVEGGQDVLGPVRATAFRHISPVRGYRTVSPMDAALLTPHEYAFLYGNESSGVSNNGNTYGTLEGRNLGYMRLNGRWYTPRVDQHRFFQKGIHAAALNFYMPYYDPLWYIYQTFSGGTTVDPTSYVLPGRTGFVIPISAPHGSKLAALNLNMSFRPALRTSSRAGEEGTGFLMESNFQMWHDMPAPMGNQTTPDTSVPIGNWNDKAAWNAMQGVQVSIWRYHTGDFGQNMPVHAIWGSSGKSSGHSKGYEGDDVDDTSWMGYAQRLFTAPQLLTTPTEGDYLASPELTPGSGFFGFETHHPIWVPLLNQNASSITNGSSGDAGLIVDRRHFSYFATVECYAGMRDLATDWGYNDDASPPPGGLPQGDFFKQQQISHGTDTVRTPFDGYEVGAPDADRSATYGPVLKFRGARVDYVTDRAGDS